jgi:cyclic pyranopterin phosphate synthase
MVGNNRASRVWKGVLMITRYTNSTAQSPDTRLLDNHNRPITYLRLSITDRCNLRCRYCRPEEGVPFIPHDEILSFEELERLAAIFCAMGVDKVRVTGGEPFARKGCLTFLQRLRKIEGLRTLRITTNGVKMDQCLDGLVDLGIDGINLSLDTLDQKRFWQITRRDYFESVLQALHDIVARQIPLKINSVVLADTSDEEIVGLAGLAQKLPITLRFIEKMPFSGISRPEKLVNGNLLQRLKKIFPIMTECIQDKPTTARIFSLPGYKGSIGLIQGYSRLFCTSCNKVRITPTGILKTCLYDNGVLDLKKMLRTGADDREIATAVYSCIQNRCLNGHEAERLAKHVKEPSMATIGG